VKLYLTNSGDAASSALFSRGCAERKPGLQSSNGTFGSWLHKTQELSIVLGLSLEVCYIVVGVN
jgi:hypothetical protein